MGLERLRVVASNMPSFLEFDDEARPPGNPGLTKATEAAREVGGLLIVAIPDFGEDRPDAERQQLAM
jgi:putative DNA primase/helicase